MNRNKQGFKRYRGLLAALVLVAVVICGCSKLQSRESAETELAAGQRKAEIQVVSITGNELTYIEVEEETEVEMQMPEGMELPEGMSMPEGIELPEGMDIPEGVDFFSDTSMGGSRENPFASSVETTTVYLPVRIKVHTGNGKTAAFSILEAGDQLEVLFEENENGEEVITEIRLIGTE